MTDPDGMYARAWAARVERQMTGPTGPANEQRRDTSRWSLGTPCADPECGRHPLNWHMTPGNRGRRCTVAGCACAGFVAEVAR